MQFQTAQPPQQAQQPQQAQPPQQPPRYKVDPFNAAPPFRPPDVDRVQVPSAARPETEGGMESPAVNQEQISLAYPFELLIFALIEYFWQSIPELLGFAPVIDNAFLLSVLVTSCINLFLSFVFTTKGSFLPWAKGFVAHTGALWIAYLHTLSESVSQGSVEVCCEGKTTAPFAKVQAAIFYDKMFMHQAIAAVTWACLTIVLVIAMLQVKSCHAGVSSFQDWFPRQTFAAAAFLVVIHTAIFVMSPVTCRKYLEFGGVILSFGIVTWLLTIDGGWIMRLVAREEMPPEHWKRVELLLFSVQSLLALLALFFSCVLVSVLGQRVSGSLVVFSSLVFVWYLSLFTRDYLGIRAENKAEKQQESAPSPVVEVQNVPPSMRIRASSGPVSGFISALPVQTKKAR